MLRAKITHKRKLVLTDSLSPILRNSNVGSPLTPTSTGIVKTYGSLSTKTVQKKLFMTDSDEDSDGNTSGNVCETDLSPGAEDADSAFVDGKDEDSQNSESARKAAGGVVKPSAAQESEVFKTPLAPAPRSRRLPSEDTVQSPFKYNPRSPGEPWMVHFNFPGSPFNPQNRASVKIRKVLSGSEDDGFCDLLHCEDNGISPDPRLSPSIRRLVHAPINPEFLRPRKVEYDSDDEYYQLQHKSLKRKSTAKPAKMMRIEECMDHSDQENIDPTGYLRKPSSSMHHCPSMPALQPLKSIENTMEHENQDQNHQCTLVQSSPGNEENNQAAKRHKSMMESSATSAPAPSLNSGLPKPAFHRCYSMNDAAIMMANLDLDNRNLIGDMTKHHTLPTIDGKNTDLKSIEPNVLASVLRGDYNDVIKKCVVIDCRYPYEYEGGHIESAWNFFTKDQMVSEFLENGQFLDTFSNIERNALGQSKTTILVFHCEFSSQRGPKLCRFLRNEDRTRHKDCYPKLYFPEIYLLEGGYKRFFEEVPELCVPCNYTPMLHEAHAEDCRSFRAKSKSWAGDKSQQARRNRAACPRSIQFSD